MLDLERLEQKTKDLNIQTSLENQLTFNESPKPVPYETQTKLKNLTSETIDVSEYSDEGVKVLSKNEPEDEKTPPKLIRSNSYTLESPSPILLAHLEKEARKCAELNQSEVIDTDVTIETVEITTPIEGIDPQLLDILNKLPENHAQNIIQILSKQKEDNKDNESIGISISSQSIYYSTLSDRTRGSPELNFVNLRSSKSLDRDKAAAIIQAHVRGYLTRRLIRTEKVQSLIKTIKDAVLCAIQLHGSEVIEEADVELHRRLIQQVSAACYAFHDIFFTLSIKEQMGIIAFDRQRKIDKANRPLSATSSTISLSRRQSAKRIR